MSARTIFGCLILVLSLVCLGMSPAQATTYPATIKYYQTMTKLLDETQLQGWPLGLETAGRHVAEMVANPSGYGLVAFTVQLDAYTNKRLYIMKPDGTQLLDCTPYLNTVGVDPNNVYGLRSDLSGDRLFFLVANTPDIYYLLPWGEFSMCYPAFKGLAGTDSRWPYSVNALGTRLFFRHVYNNAPGLYYADVGDPTYTPHPVLLMNQLPGPQNFNVLSFLGATVDGNALWCTYFGSAAGNSIAMWRGTAGHAPVKTPNEDHSGVWQESFIYNNIFSQLVGNSDSYLYAYRDSGLHKLYYGGSFKVFISDGDPLNSFGFPTLFDDGNTRIARFTGPGHKASRVNLYTGEQRDTHSSLFAESAGGYYLTDLTDFARYYFMASTTTTSRIDVIDMNPGYLKAPYIDIINFSKPVWLFDDTTPLTITVHVTDPTGPNILWVKLLALVDGLEQPVWLDAKPFYEGPLTDQGGGVYTITTTLYKHSNFFTQYKLPKDVGIRIIAKNQGEHYGISDTTIKITTGALLSDAVRTMLLLQD